MSFVWFLTHLCSNIGRCPSSSGSFDYKHDIFDLLVQFYEIIDIVMKVVSDGDLQPVNLAEVCFYQDIINPETIDSGQNSIRNQSEELNRSRISRSTGKFG